MTPFPEPPEAGMAPTPEAEIAGLLEANRHWADHVEREDPGAFAALARVHRPPFLVVGCCDARKPMDLITGAAPGRLFLHRNVANQVRPDDPAVLASLEFALGALGVRHLIVCGHTRCGGVGAALAGNATPAVRRWVEPVRSLAGELRDELDAAPGPEARADLLAARNVVRQLENALDVAPVQEALADPERTLVLHGWLFRLETGRIEELELPLARWRGEGRHP